MYKFVMYFEFIEISKISMLSFSKQMFVEMFLEVITVFSQFRGNILASHCAEVDTRWSYEYGILNFSRNSSRTLTSANQQQESLRCLPKVTRLYSNTTRRYQEGMTKATRRYDFKYDIYTTAIRRTHDALRRLHGVVL